MLIWMLSMKARRFGRLIAILKRWGYAISLFLWVVFVVFAVWYAFNFDHFCDIHDIDEAVDAAVSNVDDGVNPYEEYIVPRFKTKYRVDVEWTMGPYNYMPLDLLTYVAAEAVLGPLGTPTWFVLTNMIFAAIAMLLLRHLLDAPWLSFVPMAGTVMLFYSMDNASLTLFIMTASMLVLHRAERYPEALSLVVMSLAVMTKVYAAIPFLVMLMFFLQTSAASRNWRKVSEIALAAGVSAAFAILIMLPFGISNVLDAAVFFHTSGETRIGTSAGGTVLSELALESPYFAMIGFGLTAAAVAAGLLVRRLNDRVMLATVAFLLVAVKSSLAPLTVAGMFLALRMKEKADERASSMDTPSAADSQAGAGASKGVPSDR